MGRIRVEGLGTVEIAGNTPTAEESAAIIGAMQQGQQAAPALAAPSGPAPAPMAGAGEPSFIDRVRAANLAGGSIQDRVSQGRETLSQENIGEVLGLAGPAGGAALAAQGLRAAPAVIRAGAVGSTLAAGDIAQQSGEIISGQREDLDPAQTRLAGVLGAGGQAAGELIPTVLPSLIRGIFRGGKEGRQQVQSAIADAARVGETPTLAQATKSTLLDSLEQSMAKIPGGAGRIRQRVQETTKNVRGQIESLSRIGGTSADPTSGGKAVVRGVEDFVERFQGRSGPMFDAITDRVGASTAAPVSNTQRIFAELTTPTPGAERTSRRFVSPFIRDLAEDFAGDVGQGGTMPFQALQRVRTLVGNKLSTPSLVADVPQADLKRLYGAISEDIGTTAKSAGPEASKAFTRANRFYSTGLDRIQGTLQPLVRNRAPEDVFESLFSGSKKGPTRIRTVMRSLSPEQQDAVTGSVIRRLGTAPAGQQGAEGAEFSFDTFMTRWNQLDAAAKDTLFKRGRNLGMSADLDALARFAQNVKESSRAFANPSGTAGASIASTAGALSIGSVAASPFIGSTALILPAIAGGTFAGSNLIARLITHRPFVRWLAKATTLKPESVSAHLGRLSGIAASADPETKADILGYLEQIQQ